MADSTINGNAIETALDAVEQAFNLQFPDYHIEQFPDDLKRVPLPAIILHADDFDYASDPGTNQVSVRLKFEARFIVSFKERDAKKKGVIVGAAIAQFVLNNRFNTANIMGGGKLMGGYYDEFMPDHERYHVFAVDWTNDVRVGDIVLPEFTTPSQVLVGFSPNVGPGHEQDYKELNE